MKTNIFDCCSILLINFANSADTMKCFYCRFTTFMVTVWCSKIKLLEKI